MLIRRGYRFKLKTTPVIEEILIIMAGHARFVWNKALWLNRTRLRQGVPIIWYNELSKLLRLWKQSEEYGFLIQAHSQVLQQKLKDLEKAFKDAFNKRQPLKKLPRFKKKGSGDSFRFPQGVKIENRRVFLPKIGWVGFYKSREIPGTIKQTTITREADGWYISFSVEIEIPEPKLETTSQIGVDRGVHVFAATSDGELILPLNASKKLQKKLAFLQRKLARQKRFSKNWHKTKKKISKLHRKIARMRHDFLHKLSTRWGKSHALIVLEKLLVNNMTRSAKGTTENPGKNVKAKSGLNRAILAQGWGMFADMLGYKLLERGGCLVLVPAQYSSQTCSICGHVDSKSRNGIDFQCTVCNFSEHADVNAAKVILQRAA